MTTSNHGIVHDLRYLFAVSITNLYLLGVAIAGYGVLEGVEAVGLWYGKRWAEYLTFVATIVFIPYEIDELIKGVTALKVVAFVINVAIAVYLLYAKRLFGLRGGGKVERAEQRGGHSAGPLSSGPPPGPRGSRNHTQPSQREPRAASTLRGQGADGGQHGRQRRQRWHCRRRPGPRGVGNGSAGRTRAGHRGRGGDSAAAVARTGTGGRGPG